MRHQGYDSEDSIDTWTLIPEDHALVPGKSRVNRLGFAVLLLFFRANGRFPEASEIHPSIVARVAEQLGTKPNRTRISARCHLLRDDPGRASVKSLRQEMAKLDLIRQLDLPPDLLTTHPSKSWNVIDNVSQ